ncbi:hypothetical protein [Nocardioides nanhaiensis]|uniref:Uncharacterized protein n=1 Tax=Nocardioides nanhaiensis TaxID=1476871 RepID=A0ABP8VUB8_9ACTN
MTLHDRAPTHHRAGPAADVVSLEDADDGLRLGPGPLGLGAQGCSDVRGHELPGTA